MARIDLAGDRDFDGEPGSITLLVGGKRIHTKRPANDAVDRTVSQDRALAQRTRSQSDKVGKMA